jgi:hypothetical protein
MDHIWFYVYATPDCRDHTAPRPRLRQVPGYIWSISRPALANEALRAAIPALPRR